MGGSEKFCLQWNEFESNLKSTYSGIRKTEDYSDITLVCEDGQQIEGHRIILSSTSIFFRDLLKSNPHNHPLVYMRGVKYSDLSSIVDFIYHGEAEVLKEDLETFLEIAGELRVKGMTKHIRNNEKEAMNYEETDDKSEHEEDEEDDPSDDEMDIITPIITEDDVAAESDYHCEECGKTYSNKNSFRTHKYTFHKKDGIKQEVKQEIHQYNSLSYPVDESSAVINQANDMELEEKIDALTERRDGLWRCIQCGKCDKQKFHLRRHVETHIEGYSHACPSCEKAFSTRGNLKAHILNQHSHEKPKQDKAFECELCHKASVSKEALRMHKLRHH